MTILVQQLRAEIEQLKRAARYCEQIDATPENQRETMLYDLALERDQLRAENAELRRDAERYRWLRDRDAEEGIAVLNVGSWPQAATCIALTYISAEAVDEAVDQAMTKEQP